MKPIEFPEHNIVFGKNQPEYQPLPAHINPNGDVLQCWELSPEELQKLNEMEKPCIWVGQLTFNDRLQPIFVQVEYPEEELHATGQNTESNQTVD